MTSTAGGPVINYTYDGRGNLAGMVDNTSGKSTSYNFDALDRLSILTQTVGGGASVVTSNYRYDWGGRRIWQSISGSGVPSASQTSYLWDETSQYGDVVLETDASSGNPQVSYVLGGGELLSQDKVGVTSYYLKDGHGSVRSLSDGSGNLVAGEQYNYNAFGSLVSGPTNPASKYLYTGQQFDGQTGLYDLRARYYNSGDGRFLSQDSWPIDFNNPVELNRYIYTANNPVNYTDATGYAEGVLSYGLRLLDAVKLRYVILAGLAITVVALAIADIDTIINLAKQTKRSGKEKKDDIPSWAKNNDLLKQKKGEKPSAAAKRALDKNYGEGGWSDVGAGSEFSKLKKWFEENPGGTGEPPDDSKDNSNPKGKNR